MYETRIFADGETFFEWARKNIAKSTRASEMVGWDGAINYVNLDKDLVLLYQLEKTDGGKGWTVCGLHMLLWGAEETLRKDVCKISEFYRPAGSVLWHASVDYGDRSSLDFCVTNAFQAEGYEKYSRGGNFTMTFAGLGDYLECMNDKGVIRFYEGNPVEEERARKNDPTIDHADIGCSEMRALNPGGRDEEPALAEFSGVVEACKTVKICGVKCYRIRLMSGPPDNPSSFPWSLLVAANRIDGKYVPRVGDSVHGAAYMFGTFHGEAQEEPTVYQDRGLQEIVEKAAAKESVEHASEGKPDDGSSETVSGKPSDEEIMKGWEWLPRKPKDYPVVRAHGGGLAKSVATTLPKYVVYSEYRKRIKGELKALKDPSRKELKRILDSIDYVITSKDNLRMFGSVMDAIGIRHFVVDAKTGERHLWCGLPSGFGREHFLSNLLVALDKTGMCCVTRFTWGTGTGIVLTVAWKHRSTSIPRRICGTTIPSARRSRTSRRWGRTISSSPAALATPRCFRRTATRSWTAFSSLRLNGRYIISRGSSTSARARGNSSCRCWRSSTSTASSRLRRWPAGSGAR